MDDNLPWELQGVTSCKIRGESLSDVGSWSRKMKWKRRRGRLMTFHAQARAAIQEKKFTVARRAFLLRGGLGESSFTFVRVKVARYPTSLPLSDAEEHQLIRRTPFFLFLFRSPHNPSQTSRFHRASRFGGTSLPRDESRSSPLFLIGSPTK